MCLDTLHHGPIRVVLLATARAFLLHPATAMLGFDAVAPGALALLVLAAFAASFALAQETGGVARGQFPQWERREKAGRLGCWGKATGDCNSPSTSSSQDVCDSGYR